VRERTHPNLAPRLGAELAAVHIDADREPRSTVRSRHAVEQRACLGGSLDAVHAHVAPQFDGEGELCFKDGELVCEGRHERRQPAAVSVSVCPVGGVGAPGPTKGTRATRSMPTSPSIAVGNSVRCARTSARTSARGIGGGRAGSRRANAASSLSLGGGDDIREKERAVVGRAVWGRACGCAQGYPVDPPGVVAECGDDAVGMGPRECGDFGLIPRLRRHCAERAWERIDGGCCYRGAVRRVAMNVDEVCNDLGCRRHDNRDKGSLAYVCLPSRPPRMFLRSIKSHSLNILLRYPRSFYKLDAHKVHRNDHHRHVPAPSALDEGHTRPQLCSTELFRYSLRACLRPKRVRYSKQKRCEGQPISSLSRYPTKAFRAHAPHEASSSTCEGYLA
jgi:hypothetical protein